MITINSNNSDNLNNMDNINKQANSGSPDTAGGNMKNSNGRLSGIFRKNKTEKSDWNDRLDRFYSGGISRSGKYININIPPLSFIKNRIMISRRSLAAGSIITAVLILITILFSNRFLNGSLDYGGMIFALCILGSLLIGLIAAVRIPMEQRGQKIYSVLLYLLVPFLALFMSECIQGVFIYNFSPLATMANYLLFLLLYSLCTVFSGTLRISIIIITPIIFIFSVTADFILTSRGTPLMPADLVTVATGLDVAAGYSLSITVDYITGFLTFLGIEILAVKMPKYKRRRYSGIINRTVSLVLIAAALIPFYTTDVAADHGLKPDFWNQERGYNKSGTFLNFILNTKYLIIEKPENYSSGEVPEIVAQVLSENKDDKGILKSSIASQELERQRLEAEELTVAKNNDSEITDALETDDINTPENPVSESPSDENNETVQKLPNTSMDTPLAVQGTSTVSQPRVSAKLKKGQVPNIIAIMNETYADLRVLGQFETNMDYMPFTRSITKNTIKGNLYMPVNGAGTSNSEFEFLTGNSMAFLTGGSNAYELYIKSKLPSLAYTLEAQNYSRQALHAYYGSSWKRDVNYPLLGFENFVSVEDIIGESIIEDYRDNKISFTEYEDAISAKFPGEKVLLRRFVSDSYDYKVLENMYENRDPSKPFFMFNVTMQNHGGYDAAYNNFQQQIKLTSTEEFYPKANRFLSLIYEADQAFAELVDYFSQVSEPTIILMFGDHQPSIEDDFIESLLGNELTELTVEEKQKRYVTPFILWANYNIDEGYIDRISSNYLSTLLLQTAGIKTTQYNDYLSAIYSKLPVIDTTGYITADGTYHTYDENTEYTELLAGYEKVQYNNLFDNLIKHNDLFYINTENNIN